MPPSRIEASLKAVTFNVFHDYPACRHLERRLQLLADALRREVPDVAVLQEISVSELYGHLPERLVSALADAGLRYEVFYSPANGSVADGQIFEEGSAILSRFPIRDTEARRLAASYRVERNYHGYVYEEYRVALRATLALPAGAEIDVFGAHVTDAPPDPSGVSPRRLQIEDLARFVAERPAANFPALLGGDLNARPDSEELRRLREAGLEDVCEGREPGATNDSGDRDLENPHDSSNQRIDYLLVAPGPRGRFEPRSIGLFLGSPAEIEPGRHLWASDHSGLLADLWLKLD